MDDYQDLDSVPPTPSGQRKKSPAVASRKEVRIETSQEHTNTPPIDDSTKVSVLKDESARTPWNPDEVQSNVPLWRRQQRPGDPFAHIFLD